MIPGDIRQAFRAFTTTVGLITTHGTRGPNVMAAEWTYNISYHPFLISVHIGPDHATHQAITETREFGVSLVSEEQRIAMGFAGHYTHHEVDKLTSELFETYPARRISAPMIRGALLNAECRLVQAIPLGDHTAFIGEVVEVSSDPTRSPIVLHSGARRLGPHIKRPVAVAVAASPREVTPGEAVRMMGELTGTNRGSTTVRISLESGDGGVLAQTSTKTDDEGGFDVTLAVPPGASPGELTVVARYRSVVGRAHLQSVRREPAAAQVADG